MRLLNIEKIFKRKSLKKIKYKPWKPHSNPSTEFKRAIYLKTIIQSLKILGVNEITISTENIYDDIPLLNQLFKKNISFSIGYSDNADLTAEYFLSNFGLPVSILNRVKSGVYVYIGGKRLITEKNIPTLDLSDGNTEYIIENVEFPVKIMSFSVLHDALEITSKKLSDIIIKPCIIYESDE